MAVVDAGAATVVVVDGGGGGGGDSGVDLFSTIGGNNCRRREYNGFFRTIKWHCSPRCVRCCCARSGKSSGCNLR